jgi:rhodanese-related sulfurtransferase
MIYLSAGAINEKIKNQEAITIIDIREPYEIEVCSIGCKNIPMAEIGNHTDELRSIEQVVLMCRSGKRAESVANWLESDFQLNNIIVMEGGIVQWKEQVDPSLILED